MSSTKPVSMDAVEKARAIVRAASDKVAEDIVSLDVRGIVSFADVFVIATGRSDRQVRSIADAVSQEMTRCGERPLGTEGYEDGRWVLMDCADVVVHLFQAEMREHYDLERLWGDAPSLELGEAPAGLHAAQPS